MTQLSPTALEAAAKAVEQDLSRDMAAWIERYTGPHGCDDDAPEPPKGNYRSTPTRLATAAITAYLAQMEKEVFVVVRKPVWTPPFKVGERVVHSGNGTGTVKEIIDGVVVVEFGGRREQRILGKYDENWFRINPNMLAAAQNGGE